MLWSIQGGWEACLNWCECCLTAPIITVITRIQSTSLRRGWQHWNPWGAAQVVCWAGLPGLGFICKGPQNCEQCVLQPAKEKSQREQISAVLDGSSARAALSAVQVCGCRSGIVAKFTQEVNWTDSPYKSWIETGTGALGCWKTGPAAAKCCCFGELLVGDTWG